MTPSYFFLARRLAAALEAMIILHKSSPGVSEAALARFLARAKGAAGVRGSVNVLVTSSQELRGLNRRFRGKDRPTDVLSFPPEAGADNFAGDVAISLEIARENARRLGHSVAEELKILVLHGILHLAGHDHESDRGEMARLEERLRGKLRLPAALIERTEGATMNGGARGTGKRTPVRGRRRAR